MSNIQTVGFVTTGLPKKAKVPYAGKEKSKKKLPVPAPKPAQRAASAARKPTADPKKEGVPVALQVQNRTPLTPEQKHNVDAIMAKAATDSRESKQAALRKAQHEVKAAKAKEQRVAKKEKAAAVAAGKTTAMPLSGKAALRALANKAAKEHPITQVPPKKNGKPSPDAKTQPERRAAVKAMLAKKPAKPAFDPATVITVLSKENPKKRSAAVRFARYKTGMSVGDYIKACTKAGDTEAYVNACIRWDSDHGFIRLGAAKAAAARSKVEVKRSR